MKGCLIQRLNIGPFAFFSPDSRGFYTMNVRFWRFVHAQSSRAASVYSIGQQANPKLTHSGCLPDFEFEKSLETTVPRLSFRNTPFQFNATQLLHHCLLRL